jgi:hypothetical protein
MKFNLFVGPSQVRDRTLIAAMNPNRWLLAIGTNGRELGETDLYHDDLISKANLFYG